MPKQNSTGGKVKLGNVSKQGDRYLRSLFAAGALAVIKYAKRNGSGHRPWLAKLLERRPTKVAAVARYPSFGSHACLCEHALAIDIAALKRDGYLFTGCAAKINWRRHDQIANWINYRVEDDGLRLIYRTRGPGSDWHKVDDLIPFVETPTQFGGRRRWFSCPGCQQRCRIIYGGAYFRCRTCQGLRYESQYEAPIFRAVSQRHKLRERLGQLDSLEAPFPSKPKGMHWKTYRRLAARDAALAGPWHEAFDDLLERFDRGR